MATSTYYATTRFKKTVDEWGTVREWIEPGDKITQGDLEGVSDEEWQNMIAEGSVTDKEYTPDSAVPGAIPGTIDLSPAPEAYSDMKVEALRDAASDRSLTVARSDGKDGDPTKDDYIAALEEADKASTGTPE